MCNMCAKLPLIAALVLVLSVSYLLAEPNGDISEVDGDGIDNDGDGYTDSEDTECGSHYDGFGKVTVGGAGGQVFWVDPALGYLSPSSDPHSGTHDDPCGLRKAVDGSDRVIKFASGGTIALEGNIYVQGNNITIDGFSAPPPGVTITQVAYDPATWSEGMIAILPGSSAVHDVIINHIKFDGLFDEPGYNQHLVGTKLLYIGGDYYGGGPGVSNVIVDHLTVRDDRGKVWIQGPLENMTLSNCLFYHSEKAMSFAGRWWTPEKTKCTFYQNVWAENSERNPQMRSWTTSLDFVNNVIYNWGHFGWGYGLRIRNEPGEGHIDANIINNCFITTGVYAYSAIVYGDQAGWDADENGPANPPLPQGTVYTQSDMGQLYVHGNILPPENMDHYSTISEPLPIPQWAQVPTTDASRLSQFVPQVGMQHKDTRDQEVLDRVMLALTPQSVVGRYIFYNYCAFDGNDFMASPADDGAIAPDKTALLPGGAATFANYTSYTYGINGIMIDISRLPGVPRAGDFTFKVGNDNDPAGWADGPNPRQIIVRQGEGVGGSDRITMIFSEYMIINKWLEVTVKATSKTGLVSPDVFYFGNAVGETGNSPTDAEVTPTDVIGVRNNPHTLVQDPAQIDDAYDFNRDRQVGPADAIIARNYGSSSQTALQLITP